MKTTAILLTLLVAFSVEAQVQDPDPTRFEKRISFYDSLLTSGNIKPGGVLFVGSSSIARWNDLEKTFSAYDALNRGFGGSQFSDLNHYFDRIVKPYKPRAIFVYEGDNDVAAGKTPEQIIEDVNAFILKVERHLPGTPVAFISIKPSVARWEMAGRMVQTNAMIEAITEREDHIYYVDVWYPALVKDGEVRDDIFVQDNLHMNKKGYAIWKKAVKKTLKQMDIKPAR